MESDDKRLERIEMKLDATNAHLSSIDVTLAGQHVELKTHIKRTKMLEEEMKLVRDHVAMVHGVIKFIGLLTGLGAAYELLRSLFSDSGDVSMMRMLSLISLLIGAYLALNGKDTSVYLFVGAAFSGKVAQKFIEKK